MRIMLASVAPWCNSGYGTITSRLAKSLKADGHEVAIAATYGLKGGVTTWEGITVFPHGSELAASDVIQAHVAFWHPDFVISLCDFWHGGDAYGGSLFKWIPWLPVDHEPLPKKIKDVLARAWKVLSMSQAGKIQLDTAGVANDLIPLGISEKYHQDGGGRKAWRDAYDISRETFVYGFVGMNVYWPPRKGLDRLLEAFARVHELHSDTKLYLHTTVKAMAVPEFDLRQVMETFQVPEDSVIFTDDYPMFLGISEDHMRAMYNGFDCFVLPTHGEGFGLPVVEAQACGVPIIATDCTSMPELTMEECRVLVPASRYLSGGYSYQFEADVDALVAAMNEAYERLGPRCKCSDPQCDGFPWRRLVSIFGRNFYWQDVYANYWRPYLQQIESCLKTPHEAVEDVTKETGS